MPFSELDPRARQKEQQLESFLQLWLRKFLPTLREHNAFGDRTTPSIDLWPVQQGSQMPIVGPSELLNRSYERDKKARERLYRQGGPA